MKMKTAHLVIGTEKGKRVYTLIISESLRPIGTNYKISGKVEGRKLAALHGAKPWNF